MTVFVIYPSNIDPLIDAVRFRVGDTNETLFSDSLIRTSLISSIKQLQRRWKNRYLIFASGIVVVPQPSDVPAGYVQAKLPEGLGNIPADLNDNDVFRNPFYVFTDPNTLISQEDETPIVLTAALMLMTSKYTSSIQTFQNWSDGEFSFSNVASSRAYSASLSTLAAEIDAYFKKRLASGIRDSFAVWNI